MSIAALFTMAKRGKLPKFPPTEERINKILFIHMMEYYSALKRKESLTHAGTWMNLEDIMPSGIQHKRTTTLRFHIHEVPSIVKIVYRKLSGGARGCWGGGDGGTVFEGTELQLEKMKKFQRRMVVMVAQQCECT